LAAFLILGACSSESSTQAQTNSDEALYEAAIKDAMVAEENEIYSNLIPITDTNKYLSWNGSGDERYLLVSVIGIKLE